MNNTYSILNIEEPNDIIITSNNQLRNYTKRLIKKKEQYNLTKDSNIKHRIDKITNAIYEYNSKHKTHIKNKKNNNNKNNKNTKFNENQYLINEINKKRKYESLRLRSINNPIYWRIKLNRYFPNKLSNIIISIFAYNNRTNTLFSLLPKDIIIYIFENNFTFNDIPPSSTYHEKKINNNRKNYYISNRKKNRLKRKYRK